MKKLFSIIAVVLCLCSCHKEEENHIIDRDGVVVGITTEYVCIRFFNPKTKYKVDVDVLYTYGRDKAKSRYVLYTDHEYAIGDTIKFH